MRALRTVKGEEMRRKENVYKRRTQVYKMTSSAMFMAIGLILPFFTGQIPQIGSMLLPMHLPVLVCGMVCGWFYGGVVGFLLPVMRYFLFGMPVLFPMGLAMAFELAAYGIIAGKLYYGSRWKCWSNLYFSLISAMIGGRMIWGVMFAVLCGIAGQSFTWKMFWTGAVVSGIPGMILQLFFVPVLVRAMSQMENRTEGTKEVCKP